MTRNLLLLIFCSSVLTRPRESEMPRGSRIQSGDLPGFEDSEAGIEIDDDDYSGAGSILISTRELVRDEFE